MSVNPSLPDPQDLLRHFTTKELFGPLSADAQAALADGVTVLTLDAGEILCRQGDPGDSMFVLISGRLQVTQRAEDRPGELVLDELAPGASVGEMALITGRPRVATVTALTDARLACLTMDAFERFSLAAPDAVAHLTEVVVPRMRRSQLARVLVDVFGPLDMQTIHHLQDHLSWIRLSNSDVLCYQDDPGDSMFIVVSGRLSIQVTFPDGSRRTVGEVSPGESVGEFALLTDEPRTATVYAIRESHVVSFPRTLFEEMLTGHPQAMTAITRSIVRRRQRNLSFSSANQTTALTFAILPTGPDVPSRDFAHQLAQVLGDYGSVLHLNAQGFDEIYGKAGASQTRWDHHTDITIVGWMSEQEARHRFILYEADPTWTAWSRRCVRQADRVLIVGRAGGDPAVSRVENDMTPMPKKGQMELVLVHPKETVRPTGTGAWLANRDVRTHHHVRLGNQEDLARLGRRLRGQALGVVLGGGGARGFVHVGAIRALEEAGIRPDIIGGASMGALIGGLYASDRTDHEIVKLAQRVASPKGLFDYTLPFTSFFKSDKVSRAMQDFYGDLMIEDLWRPFFCVSTNLTKAEPVIHRTGLLWRAIRASIAIPGIFSPMVHEGDVVVDGGIMNNFPIDVMRQDVEGGKVIAVEASPRKDRMRNYDFGPSISGWQVLASRLNPFAKPMRVPSIFLTLMRATEVNSAYRSQFTYNEADLVIAPPVTQFRTLDFGAYAAIIDTGYAAAKEQVIAWAQEPGG